MENPRSKSQSPSLRSPDFGAEPLGDLQKRIADLLRRADAAIRRARELRGSREEQREGILTRRESSIL